MTDLRQSPFSSENGHPNEGTAADGQPNAPGTIAHAPYLLEVRNVAQAYPLPRESLLRPPGVVQALQGVSHRADIGTARVHQHHAHQSAPLVLGRSAPSRRIDWRKARANALKQASTL